MMVTIPKKFHVGFAIVLIFAIPASLIVSCQVVVGDNNTINSGNSAIYGPSGDTEGQSNPDAYYLDGAGVLFMQCVESTSYSTEYTVTVRNIGSIALSTMEVTWQADYSDGTTTFGEATEFWTEFLPGEIKVLSFSDYNSSSTPTSLTILTARLDPDDYSLDSIALTADPLIVFSF